MIISTDVDFRQWPRPRLGSLPNELRLLSYDSKVRRSGLRDEDYHLRQKRGTRLQSELHFRPIPRHRALALLSHD